MRKIVTNARRIDLKAIVLEKLELTKSVFTIATFSAPYLSLSFPAIVSRRMRLSEIFSSAAGAVSSTVSTTSSEVSAVSSAGTSSETASSAGAFASCFGAAARIWKEREFSSPSSFTFTLSSPRTSRISSTVTEDFSSGT